MAILVGTNTPYWGHTFLAEGNDKIYALRSLSGSSSLCVFDGTQLKGQGGLVELSSLQAMMAEGTTPGEHSCHITLLDREAVVADYTSGTLTLYPLAADGSLEGEPRIVHFSGSVLILEETASSPASFWWLLIPAATVIAAAAFLLLRKMKNA